jgi:hypothetical protein
MVRLAAVTVAAVLAVLVRQLALLALTILIAPVLSLAQKRFVVPLVVVIAANVLGDTTVTKDLAMRLFIQS